MNKGANRNTLNVLLIILMLIGFLLFFYIDGNEFKLYLGATILFTIALGEYFYLNDIYTSIFVVGSGFVAFMSALLIPEYTRPFVLLFYMIPLIFVTLDTFQRKTSSSTLDAITHIMIYILVATLVWGSIITTFIIDLFEISLITYIFLLEISLTIFLLSYLILEDVRYLLKKKFPDLGVFMSVALSLSFLVLIAGYFYLQSSDDSAIREFVLILYVAIITGLLAANFIKQSKPVIPPQPLEN